MENNRIIPNRDLPWGASTLKQGVEVMMADPTAAKALVDAGVASYAQQPQAESSADPEPGSKLFNPDIQTDKEQ